MDKCPEGTENRTECLLQAILEATSTKDFNWDPITFGFTAAIGFLALVVALLTVFQGLLAAGPGRVKASTHAVGNFASQSRSRFNMFEMAIRTNAMVPFFSWTQFVTQLAKLVASNELLELKRDKEGLKDHSATWLSILGRLKLDNPEIWTLIPRATDYLPSDIYAAPAAAEARCLALLVVLSEDHCQIIVNDRYIEVRGTTSQLSFRDHPIAGKVAAFDDFCISTTRSGLGPSGTTPPRADVHPLLIGCELIDGNIRSQENQMIGLLKPQRKALLAMWAPFGEADGCHHDWCAEICSLVRNEEIIDTQHKSLRNLMATCIALCGYPAPLWARGFPSTRLRIEDILDMIWETTPGWKLSPETVMDLFHDSEKAYGFPSIMRDPFGFRMEKGRRVNHNRTSRTGEDWWRATQGNHFNSENAEWRRRYNPHGGCISEDMLTTVNQWMLDNGDISDVDAIDVELREYLLHQLQDLLLWMEDQPGVPWKCAIRAILYRIWHREYDNLEQTAQNMAGPMSAPANAVVPIILNPLATQTNQTSQRPQPGQATSTPTATITPNGVLTRQSTAPNSNAPNGTLAQPATSTTSLNQPKTQAFHNVLQRSSTEPLLSHAPGINTSDSKAMDGIQAVIAYRALLFGIFLLLNTDTSVLADLAGAGHVESIVKVL